MRLENLAYALVQVAHNYGAVMALGGAVVGLKLATGQHAWRRRVAWLVLLAWTVQGASGASFGAVSYYYYGEFPDLLGVAQVALIIKITCVILGFAVTAYYLHRNATWNEQQQRRIWHTLAGLAGLALIGAAFLRWYS